VIQLLIFLLSVLSLTGVRALLAAPDHARIVAPAVIFTALDEGYHDTRGLV